MSRADDISKLFNKLGVSPSGYREIDFIHEYIEDEIEVLESPAVVVDLPVVAQTPAPPVVAAVVDEAPSAPLLRLLAELNHGEADHLHPPEVVEGPEGEVYSEPTTPKIVVVVSVKGGVGRSTLTAALASGLQRQGRPALALDLDPQNALRHHLCLGLDIPGIGATSLLNESWGGLPERGFAGCRLLTFGNTDHEQQKSLNRWLGQDAEWLGKRLDGLKLNGQDTVIIDVPAGNTPYLSQAMSVADAVLVVVQADVASFGALAQMDAILAPYLARAKPPQRFYVINQLDATHRFSLDMAEVFKTRLGNALLGTVHRDPAFSEAQAYGRDPLDPTVNSIGCQDVHTLCRALLERLDSDLP
ncbi:cellulose biosynthesis protein BcsQ [Pseudomonas marginalis]|uniref:cellulose biosynthesis protein BcsQ n=1 Tax=Pseudomonas marginalis TaxID=298 RepID=UPI002033AF33|nr:cellulose biosynthesis protein BcsQ [Pseudomonas marginalis]